MVITSYRHVYILLYVSYPVCSEVFHLNYKSTELFSKINFKRPYRAVSVLRLYHQYVMRHRKLTGALETRESDPPVLRCHS